MNVYLTLLLSLPLQASAFSPAARLSVGSNGVPNSIVKPSVISINVRSSSSALMAKKRRRRKDAAPAPTTQSTGELPDFDDAEAEDADIAEKAPVQTTVAAAAASAPISPPPVTSSASLTEIKRGSGLNSQLAEEVGGNVEGLDEDTILEAMRGKSTASWQPPRSIQDTLNDRSLEKFMDFDKMIEADGGNEDIVDLPDFDEVISRKKQNEAASAMQEGRVEDAAMLMDTSGMGKKAARNAERKAVALQREAEIEAEDNKFSFEGLNVLKLLENGAWVGIGSLVLWEFYINSPLFDRALPISPVVFDGAAPPGM